MLMKKMTMTTTPLMMMMTILTELRPVHSPPPLHQASVFCWNPVANCNFFISKMIIMSKEMVLMVMMIIKMTKMIILIMLASTLLPKQGIANILRFNIHLVLGTPGLLIPLLVKVVPKIWLNCELVVRSYLP